MGYPKVDDEYDGRYRIVRRIGHGGMGVVYEAVDKVLNRSVALKIVLPSLPDREDFHARFAREASVLARIRSRNIVGIHEYGEHDDTVYFVTELFPDGDLRSWLGEHGPLDRRAALVLVAQTCEALADAHAAGIIHRDVKPGNVLLWNRPEGLIPYLCDFGIALDGRNRDQEGLTRAGTLVGSPAYMAPERHFGHAADERGDVYSMGCLLWAVLTGDAPYSGTDFQMINSHVNSPVPQLGTGDPVDERIDELLAHVLHKDPEQRVQSAADLREELLAVVRDIDVGRLPAPGPAPVVDATAGDASAGDATAGEASADEAEEQDEHTVAKPLAASLAAATARPDEAGPQPDSTVVRDLVAPVPAARRTPPGDRDGTGGAVAAGPGRRRRGALAAVGAAATVAAVALTAFLVSATAGDDEPVAGAPGIDASPPFSQMAVPTAPTSTMPLLAEPAPPATAARPAYRSVRFTVRPPRAPAGTRRAVQVDDGSGWRTLRAPAVSVATRQGGDRACLDTRTVVRDDSGQTATSEVARACDRAQPRTVRLVRTPGACTTVSQGFTYPCQWYGVEVAGFADGSRPRAELRPAEASQYCLQFERCQPVPVDREGRGRIDQWFRVATDSGVWVLSVDGVTTRAPLYYR